MSSVKGYEALIWEHFHNELEYVAGFNPDVPIPEWPSVFDGGSDDDLSEAEKTRVLRAMVKVSKKLKTHLPKAFVEDGSETDSEPPLWMS